MDKLLSKKDIEKIIKEPLYNYYTYHDLPFIRDWRELFRYGDKVLLLYVGESRVGHWTGLKIVGNKIIFFDPLGEMPDYHLDFIDTKFRAELSRILYYAPFKIEYNCDALQSQNANTCGRWCALFFIYCTNIDKFCDIFKKYSKKYDLDYLVYLLTI